MATERIIRWSDYGDSGEEYCIPTWIDGAERWSYPLHAHEGQAEAMVLLEGSLRHRLNGGTKDLEAGDAVFVAVNDEHSLAARGTRVRLLNLAFPSSAPSLLSSLGADSVYRSGFSIHLPPSGVERFVEYADGLVRGADGHTAGYARRALLAEFLLWFSRVKTTDSSLAAPAGNETPTAKGSVPPPWFADLVSWSELPGKTPPPLGELVARSGRTEEHLCRCFRRFLGTSPGAFLIALRIRRAKDLLSHSNWPLADVCFASGFESLGRFYAAFAALEGLPPGRYRAARSRNPYAGKFS